MESSKSPGEHLQMLRLQGVMQRCGLSKALIYRLEAQGLFPRRVKLTARASAWLASDVDRWLRSRVAHSRGEMPDA